MTTGHLFIVRADITQVGCDGWLVPGDEAGPGNDWRERYAFGGTVTTSGPSAAGNRVVRWQPASGDERIPWVVHMGGDDHRPIEWYIDGVEQFLRHAANDPGRATKRALPLYAIPLVGTGGGGARSRSGELTRALIPALMDLVESVGVDLALCCWTKSHYAAAQEARKRVGRRDARVWSALPRRLQKEADSLAEDTGGALTLFVGAGVSQNAGLRSWDGMLTELAHDLGLDAAQVNDLREIRDPLARAEATRAVAGASEAELKRAVAERIERVSSPSLCHCILASLGVEQAITTNYDRLLERAWSPHRRDLRILPYQSVRHGHPWLLKLHGTTVPPDDFTQDISGEDIVVTRGDYARFDLRWRALASIVETLLVTRRMLFVGFSLADANFQRMVDTVRRAVRGAATPLPEQKVGTILEVNPTPYLGQVWGDEFSVVSMSDSRAENIYVQARRLEVFLDRMAAGSYPRSAYLLDPTATGLLDDDEKSLHGHLSQLITGLQEDPVFESAMTGRHAPTQDAFAKVRELLESLGYRHGHPYRRFRRGTATSKETAEQQRSLSKNKKTSKMTKVNTMKLKIGGVPEHFNLPWRVADDCGYWAARGLDVDWKEQGGGTGQMLARLESGELDAAVILTEGIITAISKGLQAKIVALYIDTPLYWGLHVAHHARFTKETDLKTARFARTRFGSGSHLMAYVLADRLGFDVDESRFVEVGSLQGARDALAAGEADVLMWDRFMLGELVERKEFKCIGVQPTPWPSFVIAAREGVDFAQVRKVTNAIAELAASLKETPDLGRLAQESYGILPRDIQAWERECRWSGGPVSPKVLRRVQSQLLEVGLLSGKPKAPSHFLA